MAENPQNKEEYLLGYNGEDRVISSQEALEKIKAMNASLFRFDSKIPGLDKATEGFEAGELIVISGPTKNGKCFAKGTKILMYDGITKKVEDIRIGDKIMGDDSTARNVLSLGQGKEMMYKVSNRDKSFYIVNESHILSLQKKWGKVDKILNISIRDYLKKSNDFKANYRGYKKGVVFKDKIVEISPYLLGLWLGDGTSANSSFTTMDKKIVEYLYRSADKLGLKIIKIIQKDSKASTYRFKSNNYKPELLKTDIGKFGGQINYYKCKICNKIFKRRKNSYSGGIFCSDKCQKERNKLLNSLKKYNLINNKHIPNEYLVNSRKKRLELLAGLIDSDGFYSKLNGVVFCNKNKLLCDNVIFLVRSLGLYASLRRIKINNQYYYDVYIGGKIEQIPVLLKYKTRIIQTSFRKNLLSQKIKIKKLKIDNYYGFEIDGNKLFLLENFSVVHNTTLSTTLTRNFEKQGVKCLWFQFEVPERQFITKFPDLPLFYLPNQLKDKNMQWIRDRILEGILKFNTRIIFIDHLHYLIDIYKANSNEMSIDIGRVIRDLKKFAVENNVVIFVMAHTTKIHLENTPSSEDIRDSSFISQEADSTFMVWREAIKRKRKVEYTGNTFLLVCNHRRTGAMGKAIKLVYSGGYLNELDIRESEVKEEIENDDIIGENLDIFG